MGREWFLAALPYPFDSYHDQVNVTSPSSILLHHGGRGGRNLDFNFYFFLTKKQVCLLSCIYFNGSQQTLIVIYLLGYFTLMSSTLAVEKESWGFKGFICFSSSWEMQSLCGYLMICYLLD